MVLGQKNFLVEKILELENNWKNFLVLKMQFQLIPILQVFTALWVP